MSIRLVGLTKRFGDNTIVNHLDLEVRDEELFVLLGASGSGKSTVLRLIAGLVFPDRGQIFLNGVDVTSTPPQRRKVGFVFQNYALFRHMTVEENIGYGLLIRRTPASDRRRRTEELLGVVGLAGLSDRYPDQLSGGQQQRVALARALAYGPEVLLLDEPFGALDVKIRGQLRESFKALQRRIGVTTILVTHDQEEAFELGDRIGVLDNGRLVEAGTPSELYAKPRTARVARFVGGGNVLLGRQETGGIRIGEALLPVPASTPPRPVGGPARVLVRPEHVALSMEPTKEGHHTLGQATVADTLFSGPVERTIVEFQGPEFSAPGVTSHGPRHVRIESLGWSREGAAPFLPGESVWVHLREFRLLEPPQFRLLAVDDGSEPSDAAVDFGCTLAYDAHAIAGVIATAPSRADADDAANRLDRVRRAWASKLPEIVLQVTVGPPEFTAVSEARQGQNDLVVLGYRTPTQKFSRALGSVVQGLLERARVPVLLVPERPQHVERILVVVPSDAPEVAEVALGALLATRLRAQVTVLRVRSTESPPDPRTFEREFAFVKSSIEAAGTSCRLVVRPEEPVEAILKEDAASGPDLIVLGVFLPLVHRPAPQDLPDAILRRTARPILLVPRIE
jgi:sulfate/thiosulfate transport system ATP-binding protein